MAFKPFYRRRFLNRRGHHAGAYAIAECTIVTYSGRAEVSAFLTLADCSRVAVIDLSGATSGELGNAVRKAQLLREVVSDLCVAVEAASVEVAARRQVS